MPAKMPPSKRRRSVRGDHDSSEDDDTDEDVVKTDTTVTHHDFAVGDRLDIDQSDFQARGLVITRLQKVRCETIARYCDSDFTRALLLRPDHKGTVPRQEWTSAHLPSLQTGQQRRSRAGQNVREERRRRNHSDQDQRRCESVSNSIASTIHDPPPHMHPSVLCRSRRARACQW